MINDYQQIEPEKPFFILHKDPRKQDITVWQKRADGYGLVIYFHVEGFWCNPPTDTNMESNAIKKIERYGIAYLPDGAAYIEGYKNTPVMEKSKYRQEYADNFFGKLGAKV